MGGNHRGMSADGVERQHVPCTWRDPRVRALSAGTPLRPRDEHRHQPRRRPAARFSMFTSHGSRAVEEPPRSVHFAWHKPTGDILDSCGFQQNNPTIGPAGAGAVWRVHHGRQGVPARIRAADRADPQGSAGESCLPFRRTSDEITRGCRTRKSAPRERTVTPGVG